MRLRIWRQDVILTRAIRAAAQHHEARSRLFLEIEEGGVSGFGEVAPQPFTLNGDPAIDDVIDEFRAWTQVQLSDCYEREGALPSWSRVARWAGPRAASGPAVALMEMALLDRELRSSATTIEELWPPMASTPLQGTVSLVDDGDLAVPPGIARMRVKVTADAMSPAKLHQLRDVDVPVMLDFNCSARDSADVMAVALSVGAVCDLVAVEQPFAPGNVVDHAKLAQRLSLSVSIDEGMRSPRDIDQIVRYGAAHMVCIKPARVGGLANARTLVARAQDKGLQVYIGGFFESPFARRANRALADQAVVGPSDLGPVSVEGMSGQDEVALCHESFGLRPSRECLEHAVPIALSV